ncbi:MAG: hypothetical protein AAF517_25285, partial [Planctomycetota bacterium]
RKHECQERRATVLRSASPALLTFVLAAGLFLPLHNVQAQSGEGSQPRYITISKVSVGQAKGKKPKVKVTGKSSLIPSGTKVEFRVTWMSQVIHSATEAVSGSSFSVEFTVPNAPLTTDDFEIITVIDLAKQSSKVRAKLKKDPEKFPPTLNPWTEYHRDQKFKMADAEAVKQEVAEIRAFFLERLSALSAVRKTVLAGAQAAKDKTEYTDDDKFDAKKWRKFIDKEGIRPVAAIQKELKEAWESKRFQPYRRALFPMRELSNCVAFTVVDASTQLYKEAGLELDPMDTDPEENKLVTETRTRNPTEIRELKRLGKAVRGALPAAPAPTAKPDKKKDNQ